MRRWVPVKTNPSRPSMSNAMENVSRTLIIVSVAGRSRAISRRCMTTPATKNNGTVITSDSSGSRPVCRSKNHAMYAARMSNAEWAIITTRITPK